MKSIKKIFRVIFCFMAFACASLAFAINPTVKTYAAKEYTKTNYQKAISAVKMPSKVDASKEGAAGEFRIPLLKNNFGTDYTIKVVDPAGQTHEYKKDTEYFSEELGEGDNKYIKVLPLNEGLYDVVYVINDGTNKFYSNKYTVNVTNVSYELDFTIQSGNDKGKKVILPSAVAVEKDGKVRLPFAYAKNTATESVNTEEPIKPYVLKDNVTELKVDEPNSPLTIDEDGYYCLSTASEGVYTIQYSYNYGSNPPSKTFELEVLEDFETPTAKTTTITTPTLPSIQLGQKEIDLRSLTVSDKYSDNVDHNVTITIAKANNSAITKTLPANTYTFDMTKEFFGVDDYAKLVGDYKIIYHVETAYANKDFILVTAPVTDAALPKVFMAYDYDVVINEETKETTLAPDTKVNTDYTVDLKSTYGYGELLFPAIYAEDSVTEFKDFEFVRYIQKVNTSEIFYLDNVRMVNGERIEVKYGEQGYNYAAKDEGNTVGQFNKAVNFKFKENMTTADAEDYAGEYTLGYYVFSNTVEKQENYVYETGTTRFRIKVLSVPSAYGSSEVKVSTPSISINNLKSNTSISPEDKLSINVSSSDSDNTDRRLKNAVYTFYGNKTSLKEDITKAIKAIVTNYDTVASDRKSNVLDSDEFISQMTGYTAFRRLLVDEKNANNFELELTDFAEHSSERKVTVVAVTINDFGNIDVDYRVLDIKDTTDTIVPEYTKISVEDDYDITVDGATFDQGKTIVLPTVTFTDNTDTSLLTSVSYYIDSPESEEIGLNYLPTIKPNLDNTIVGGSIKTGKAGKYYVVYTATDDAGNSTSVYFTFMVNEVKEPMLSVDVSGDTVKKSGQYLSDNVGGVIRFSPTVYNSDLEEDTTITDIKLDVDNGDGLDYVRLDKYVYQFNDAGTYTFTFTAKGGELKKVIFVNITRPELKWDKTPSVKGSAKKGEVVNLPLATASQGSEKAKVTVEVTKPNGDKLDASEISLVTVNDVQVWQFTTDEKASGTYKVVYTAKTANSSISTEAYSIKVGDSVKPTITMNYEKELQQNITFTGSNIEYKINLEKYNTSTTTRKLEIVVTCGDKTIYKYDTGLKITDTDDDGGKPEEMSWSRLNVELTGDSSVLTKSTEKEGLYTISGKGDFALKLSITDRNGNTREKELKFKVIEKAEVKEDKDLVIGVVLIVVSLVVLAGVILFFALTGKKGNKSKSPRRTKTTTKLEDTKSSETMVEEKDDEVVVEEDSKDEINEETKSDDAE